MEFTRLGEDSSKVPGLGLGLSIVERIAELLDHEVSVTSTPGSGTRFQVTVPKGEPAIREISTAAKSPVQSHNLSGIKILCLDNDLSILEGMRALLEQWGCTVECAASFVEAQNFMRTYPEMFNILLIDYHLDEKEDGIEIATRLREEFGHTLPAILITADRSQEVKQQASDSSILILNKPVKPAALRAIISRNVQQQEAAE